MGEEDTKMPNTDPAVHTESVPEDALEVDQLDDVSGGFVGGIQAESSVKEASEIA